MIRVLHNDPMPFDGRPVATVGTFDGVHVGHGKVIEAVVQRAASQGGKSVAITFDPHPLAVLRPDDHPQFITSLEHRLLLFEKRGIDATVVIEFDKALAATTAVDFIDRIVKNRIGAGGLVMGAGAHIGQGGEGTGERLAQIAGDAGIDLEWIDPVTLGGERVSSTRIRHALQELDLARVEEMLGRPFSVLGPVIPGKGHGRNLGFRTANVDVHLEVHPPSGVYTSWASVGDGWRPSVTSIGPAAGTAGMSLRPVAECHVFGFEGDLYGREIEVAFDARLRDQERFESDAALSAQIACDVKEADGLLAAARPPCEEILA